MFIQSYKIVEPRRFEVFIEELRTDDSGVPVKIEYAAICKADLRYYLGERDAHTLGLKYPLALIHEATGTVLKTKGGFCAGDRVVLIPNIVKERCDDCSCDAPELGRNYCPNALFASSNADGFSKQIVALPAENLLKIPEGKAYVFCELISVAVAALRRLRLSAGSELAVWGDGILGYVVCAVAKKIHGCRVTAIGRHEEKLNEFDMCDKTILTGELKKSEMRFDAAVECVGGKNAGAAIEQITDTVCTGGRIIITGVSEEPVSLSTRKILEKGLSIAGSTRSNAADFQTAVELISDPKFSSTIEKLLGETLVIENINDYYTAFEKELQNGGLFKYVLKMDY